MKKITVLTLCLIISSCLLVPSICAPSHCTQILSVKGSVFEDRSDPDSGRRSYGIPALPLGTHVKGRGLNGLDITFIGIIKGNAKLTPSEIYDQVTPLLSSEISRALVWSRLVGLVESGYVDLVHINEDSYAKSVFVCGKPRK